AVKVPWNALAVSGSIVEIPCMFDYPTSGRNPRVLWLKGDSKPRAPGVSIIYSGRDPVSVNHEYEGRTELSGNLTKKQCSLLIKHVRKRDEGEYYIKVKITNNRNASDSYSNSIPVSLRVLEKPQIAASSRNNFENSWTLLSTFSFTPSADHHGQTLIYELIKADGVVTGQQTLRLDVKYEPILVIGLNCTSSRNEASCTCIVKANPPVTITWNISGKNITGNTSDVTVYSWAVNNGLIQSSLTLTHLSGSEEQIICRAGNENGVTVIKSQLNSTDFKYRSTVKSSQSQSFSKCHTDPHRRKIAGNTSDIIVYSWTVNNGLIQSSPTLIHLTGFEQLFSCIAENEQGGSVSRYQLCSTGTSPNVLTCNYWKQLTPSQSQLGYSSASFFHPAQQTKAIYNDSLNQSLNPVLIFFDQPVETSCSTSLGQEEEKRPVAIPTANLTQHPLDTETLHTPFASVCLSFASLQPNQTSATAEANALRIATENCQEENIDCFQEEDRYSP
ncbi:sialoadhesin-like, partial [Stegostoma tigrinum]|uniref:sialoadhesin-like n=1 Tax=Stegostoma tigrinum TaxID=3053191 RepID=UPI0028705A90